MILLENQVYEGESAKCVTFVWMSIVFRRKKDHSINEVMALILKNLSKNKIMVLYHVFVQKSPPYFLFWTNSLVIA